MAVATHCKRCMCIHIVYKILSIWLIH